jgi:hypothetical protein
MGTPFIVATSSLQCTAPFDAVMVGWYMSLAAAAVAAPGGTMTKQVASKASSQ